MRSVSYDCDRCGADKVSKPVRLESYDLDLCSECAALLIASVADTMPDAEREAWLRDKPAPRKAS